MMIVFNKMLVFAGSLGDLGVLTSVNRYAHFNDKNR